MSLVFFFIAEMAGEGQEIKRKKMTKKKDFRRNRLWQARSSSERGHRTSASSIEPESTPVAS
jgi:hypothetical protein